MVDIVYAGSMVANKLAKQRINELKRLRNVKVKRSKRTEENAKELQKTDKSKEQGQLKPSPMK